MVDDEVYCLDSLKAIMFNRVEFESRCDQVMSGEEAIESIRVSEAYGVRYQLILTDI